MNQLQRSVANSIRRRLLRLWESHGGGFYGFVAVLTFIYLEVVDIGGDIAALPGSSIDAGFIISFIISNLVDAFANGFKAAIWPAWWISGFGVSLLSAALLGGSYVAYLAIRPAVLRLLTPSDGAPAPLISRSAAQ